MDERRFNRTGDDALVPRAARVEFCFDLGSPYTYLAAERVDRLLPGVAWRPVLADVVQLPPVDAGHAERRAAALGLPLVWPEHAAQFAGLRPVMRVASLAAEQGRGAAFVLAASRLAFCGGFDLEHPQTLAEASAAAGLALEDALRAAGDHARDEPMEDHARRLVAAGCDRLPAIRVGRLVFGGEDRLGEAVAAMHRTSPDAV